MCAKLKKAAHWLLRIMGNLLEQDSGLYISNVSWVEFHSVLHILVARKGLTVQERDLTLKRFNHAIQLASALEAAEKIEEPVMFLTADHQLEAAARREKLPTRI